MARPRRAVSAQRRRRAGERAISVIKMRIISALKRSLCLNHFFRLNDDVFQKEVIEVSGMVNEFSDWAEESVLPFFPESPTFMTQGLVQDFHEWLISDLGEPLRSECLRWCHYMMKAYERCAKCRSHDSEIVACEESPVVNQGVIQRGESSAAAGSEAPRGGYTVAEVAELESSNWNPSQAPKMSFDKAWQLIQSIISAGDKQVDPMLLDPNVSSLTPPDTCNLLNPNLVYTRVYQVFSMVVPNNGQPFEFIQHLEGCHKGMTMKGVHQLKHYLKKFGYLSYNDLATPTNHDEFDGPLESAVKTYQLNYGLNVTGSLDSQTVKEMMEPRCGVPDIIDGRTRMLSGKGNHQYGPLFRYFSRKQKWPASKTNLTFRFRSKYELGDILLRSVMWRAFAKWAAVTHFTFTEVDPTTRADIDIGLYRLDHGDGHSFDGPLGVLAHAFAPTSGKLHFDVDENWTSSSPGKNEFDLESVALHEIGHILGLGHSGVPGAVMVGKIGSGVIRRELQPDDILGIRSLYNIHG